MVHEVPNVLGGSHTYTATYVSDNGNFATSSGNATVVVDKTSTSVGLTATKDGRRVTLTSTVSSPIGSPAGTVSFLDGGVVVDTKTVAGGSATLVLNGVASGSHDYTATFAPTQDTRYLGSTSVVRNVTLTPEHHDDDAGGHRRRQHGHLRRATSPARTARRPAPSIIKEDGSQVGFADVDRRAGRTFVLTNVPSGSHTYTATYSYTAAGGQFAASSSQPVTVTVSNVAPAATTSTTLTATATRRTVTLQAAVSLDRWHPDRVGPVRPGRHRHRQRAPDQRGRHAHQECRRRWFAQLHGDVRAGEPGGLRVLGLADPGR